MKRRAFEFDNFVVAGDDSEAILDLSLNRQGKILPAPEEKFLESISMQLDNLLRGDALNRVKLIKTILHELSPALLEKCSLQIVSQFLADKIPGLCDRKVLDFYFNPRIIALAHPLLAELAEKGGFVGQIFLHKDAGLAACDCRIEWQNGSVAYDSRAEVKRLEKLLTENEYE